MWLSDCLGTSLLLANDVSALQGRRYQQLLLNSVGKVACGQHKRNRQHACDHQCGPLGQKYGFDVRHTRQGTLHRVLQALVG